jgi:tetratricopeptide (TPR) repeat protein
MGSSNTVVRQTSWLMVVPQLLVLALCMALTGLALWPRLGIASASVGAFAYLAYSFGSRWVLLRPHRNGLRLTSDGNFPEAIRSFEQSYAFFSKHGWIDRYRYLTMLTPSAISFREMALINIAYCYVQMEDWARAKHSYQSILAQFPNSQLARRALELLDNIERQQS